MDKRVLVLAPKGRDAAVIGKVLQGRQIATTECATSEQLVALLDQGAAGAIVTDDSFAGDNFEPLRLWLQAQPPWSDFPFIVLTSKRPEAGAESAVGLLHGLGNFILLERPVNADTLARAAASAVRARLRQYETRRTLDELTQARSTVHALNLELEDRIAARTEALAAANDRLMLEISERERAQASLVHVQKLEAVGRLTGGIAHDFNNLLQVVSMNVDLVMRKAGDPKLVELAGKAKQAVGKGAKLTAQLLSFARTQSLLPKAVDINELITGMRDLIGVSAGAQIALELHLCEAPAFATVDAVQLEMALLNLAVNAKDAMCGKGALVVATRCMQGGGIDGLSPQRHVVVSVTDTGTGIPKALLAKVFEPFFTTKPLGSGTGLGLSQVYGFARQSGGTARVESTVNEGTTVEIWFPAIAPEAASEAMAAAPAPGRYALRQILVVEDDAEVRRVIVESLESAGHTVRSAASGEEGLVQMRQARPDLLMVDYAMPGMNGAQLIAQVRAMDSATPILLSTGYADMAEVARVLPSTSILLKPFDVAALLSAVDAACNGSSSSVSSAIASGSSSGSSPQPGSTLEI